LEEKHSRLERLANDQKDEINKLNSMLQSMKEEFE
jgi:hypothetical protein